MTIIDNTNVDAFAEGWDAYFNILPDTVCPYSEVDQDYNRTDWYLGYYAGRDSNVTHLGTTA